MNRYYRKKYHREVEDASSEGMMASNNSITGRESLLSSVVKAASVFNNLLLENCNVCTVYCDKQVQYEEIVQQQYDVGKGAMGHLYSQLNATAAATSITPINAMEIRNSNNDRNVDDNSDFINPISCTNSSASYTPKDKSTNNDRIKVEQYYREFLFDEESVVRSVGTRGFTEDDDNGDGDE